ncbi:hypothetical protein MD484_g2564, partial [Candolleomyces efflorescens]
MSPMPVPPDVEAGPSVPPIASAHDQRRPLDESDDDLKTAESTSEYPSEILLSPSRIFRSARLLDHEGRHTPCDPFEDKNDRKQSSSKRDDRQRHSLSSAGPSTSPKARRNHRQSKTKEPKRMPETGDHEDMKKMDRKIHEIRQFLVQSDMTRSAQSRALVQDLANAREQLEETQRLAHWTGPAR